MLFLLHLLLQAHTITAVAKINTPAFFQLATFQRVILSAKTAPLTGLYYPK